MLTPSRARQSTAISPLARFSAATREVVCNPSFGISPENYTHFTPHLPVPIQRKLAFIRRLVFLGANSHAAAQHGRLSSTILSRSDLRAGFATMRWPLMRRPSRASSGVISVVTKTIGTSCSAQSASSCAATSEPSVCGMIRSTSYEVGLEATRRFQCAAWIVHRARDVIPGLFEKQTRAARELAAVIDNQNP